jgi:hypothetical protein
MNSTARRRAAPSERKLDDGRLLVPRIVADDTLRFVDVTVILNWFEELREQGPIPE